MYPCLNGSLPSGTKYPESSPVDEIEIVVKCIFLRVDMNSDIPHETATNFFLALNLF